MIGPSCTIIGGSARRGIASSRNNNPASGRASNSPAGEPNTSAAPLSVQDASYTLQQETNEFLTQLSQSLSDENDALINLIRTTLSTLRDIQGHKSTSNPNHDESLHYAGAKDSGISIPAIDLVSNSIYNDLLTPPSIDVLSDEMSLHLSNLRDLLSNPSFAPVEEVQVREEEIQRLREGWEKMEMRWKEAVGMMLSFRQRIAGSDEESPVKNTKDGKRWQEEMDELTRGLDEVTMTMEGIKERRKGDGLSLGMGRAMREESMAEESLFDSSRVDGSEVEVEEEGEEQGHSDLIDESVIDDQSTNDEGVVGEASTQDESVNINEDETTTIHNSTSAQELTPTRSNSNTRTPSIPPIPSRSPLRDSRTSHQPSRSNNTQSNILPPPSAMRDKRSRSRHETKGSCTTDDRRRPSRKVSFKHLQSPSIINISALENDVDELG